MSDANQLRKVCGLPHSNAILKRLYDPLCRLTEKEQETLRKDILKY